MKNKKVEQHVITELILENQKLKQERDEEREHLSAIKHFLNKYIAERDEWSAMCGQYKQERDSAREALRLAQIMGEENKK